MENASQYNFEDFTLRNYQRILEIAKKKYPFKFYTEINQANNFVLWRHDIDYCVYQALTIARLEAQFSVKSTFFLLLHNDFYNALTTEIRKILHEILELGHKLGLHFDADYYDVKTETELEKVLKQDKQLLEELAGTSIDVFSFHNPTPLILQFNKEQYAGMVNTYNDFFQKEVDYCSDSNGYWRFQRLEDVVQQAKNSKLQVLTHPIWWTEEVMSPRNKIARSIAMNAERQNASYDALLEKFQRKNVK